MRFRIDLKIFVFLILFYSTKQIQTYAMVMFFAIIHEFGHLIAGLIFGMKPDRIEIRPYGLSISFKLTPKDYNKKIKRGNLLVLKKIFVAIAGPLTNVFVIIICYYIEINLFAKLMIIYSNILLIIFNLIPIYPLDGGRILKGILHIICGKQKSEKYINTISFITIIILTILSSIFIYMVENIAIFLSIIFLWCLYIKQDLIFRKKSEIYKLAQKTIEIT